MSTPKPGQYINYSQANRCKVHRTRFLHIFVFQTFSKLSQFSLSSLKVIQQIAHLHQNLTLEHWENKVNETQYRLMLAMSGKGGGEGAENSQDSVIDHFHLKNSATPGKVFVA